MEDDILSSKTNKAPKENTFFNQNENKTPEDLQENSTGTNETETKEELNNKFNAKFWIGLICALLLCVQFVLNNLFDINFEIQVAVEVLSAVIAFLIFLGVLKYDNGKKEGKENIEQIKSDVKKSFNEEINKHNKK